METQADQLTTHPTSNYPRRQTFFFFFLILPEYYFLTRKDIAIQSFGILASKILLKKTTSCQKGTKQLEKYKEK